MINHARVQVKLKHCKGKLMINGLDDFKNNNTAINSIILEASFF